ncbi:hypothetical protein T265_07079 [Opisthorchis viverrini]|uniref:Uncharacterized protein n=1 Tax=Opisthorchis viverrini TaxID=6198 RepID=A0A074ZDU5_OPIVI|nr:hypothetical protein T265_07079 [Opisthorchis viverrini]KER25456.1 hypothetical protein T265_07079 [Opisthorchis viverrini]
MYTPEKYELPGASILVTDLQRTRITPQELPSINCTDKFRRPVVITVKLTVFRLNERHFKPRQLSLQWSP